MMDNNLNTKFCKQFGCWIGLVYQSWTISLCTADGRLYDLDEATDEELNALMKESIDSGRNVLLEKFQDKEYTVIEKPGCDY